jgi:hypothetical protein
LSAVDKPMAGYLWLRKRWTITRQRMMLITSRSMSDAVEITRVLAE